MSFDSTEQPLLPGRFRRCRSRVVGIFERGYRHFENGSDWVYERLPQAVQKNPRRWASIGRVIAIGAIFLSGQSLGQPSRKAGALISIGAHGWLAGSGKLRKMFEKIGVSISREEIPQMPEAKTMLQHWKKQAKKLGKPFQHPTVANGVWIAMTALCYLDSSLGSSAAAYISQSIGLSLQVAPTGWRYGETAKAVVALIGAGYMSGFVRSGLPLGREKKKKTSLVTPELSQENPSFKFASSTSKDVAVVDAEKQKINLIEEMQHNERMAAFYWGAASSLTLLDGLSTLVSSNLANDYKMIVAGTALIFNSWLQWRGAKESNGLEKNPNRTLPSPIPTVNKERATHEHGR
jgi:hypothetical protein